MQRIEAQSPPKSTIMTRNNPHTTKNTKLFIRVFFGSQNS